MRLQLAAEGSGMGATTLKDFSNQHENNLFDAAALLSAAAAVIDAAVDADYGRNPTIQTSLRLERIAHEKVQTAAVALMSSC